MKRNGNLNIVYDISVANHKGLVVILPAQWMRWNVMRWSQHKKTDNRKKTHRMYTIGKRSWGICLLLFIRLLSSLKFLFIFFNKYKFIATELVLYMANIVIYAKMTYTIYQILYR